MQMDKQLIDYRQVLVGQKNLAKPIFEKYGTENARIQKALVDIETLFDNRLNEFQPEIMFYGIYNAGKSSLLNALMGQELAKVADVPTTDSIDFYTWQGYRLADTPGVNAPIKHQQVTQEHLRRSDVVIFVMSTNGGFEDAFNYSQMAQIINSGKQLIIVLNDKVGYMPGNPDHDRLILEIKQKIAMNMLQTGIANSIERIDNKYQVILVHAARALRGRLEGSSEWVTRSNIDELEKAILREIKRTDGFKILINVLNYFETDLKILLETIESKAQDNKGKEVTKLLASVREQKDIVRNSMTAAISGMSKGLELQLTQRIWSNRTNEKQMEEAVNNIVIEFAGKIQTKLMTELEQSQGVLKVKLSEAIKSLTEIQENIQKGVQVQKIVHSAHWDEQKINSGSTETIKDETDFVKKTLDVLQKIAPIIIGMPPFPHLPTHPGILNPKLSQEVAEQALKVAITYASKAGYKQLAKVLALPIPYIGPFIQIALILYDLFGSSSDSDEDFERKCREAKMMNEQERRRVEMELQVRQELRQNCSAMVYDLTEAMVQAVREQIGEAFQTQEDLLEKNLEQMDSASANLASDIKLINEVMDECRALKIKISN